MKTINQNNISIHLFGTPVIKVGQEIFLLKRKRARALVYYLAVSSVPVSRQELAGVLFSQLNDTAAFRNLSTYLHNINTEIPGMLDVGKEFIAISKSVYIDVREFESCFQNSIFTRENAKRAIELYKDIFLKHFNLDDSYEFEQWINLRREYYKNRVINATVYIADELYSGGKLHEALMMLMDILELDPFREDIYVRAMKANYELGNRPGAVKLYEKLTDLLSEELGISPMPETIQLYSDIITEKKLRDTIIPVNKKQLKKENFKNDDNDLYNISDDAKKLLALLTFSRNKFRLTLMSKVLGYSEQEVLHALDEIIKTGILSIGRDNSIVLILMEECMALVNSLSVPEQNYLYYRLAHEMEKACHFMNYEAAEELLYYYQKSGDNEKILEYALLVGEMANDREEFCKALDCYNHACAYLEGDKLLELKSSIAQIKLLIGDNEGARAILIENVVYARNKYQFGIACAFELEAYLCDIAGFQEILWGIQPQYAIKKDEKQFSNMWIAEQYLSQEPEHIYYYIRFLQCKALYYELLMRPEEALESYIKIIDLCKDNKNTRLKNYIDVACMKLGIYHHDPNHAEKYLRIGIAHANECKNLRTLPFLLALSAKLDISLGRIEVPRYNLEWAASLASNCHNVYAGIVVGLATVELKVAMDQREDAVLMLQKLLDQSVKIRAFHVEVLALRKLLQLEEGKELWEKCRIELKRLEKQLSLSAK